MSHADSSFAGAKVILIDRLERVLVYLRDDKPDLVYPAHWDLPGGCREIGETPAQCALRELHEEFGLLLTEDRFHWSRRFVDDADHPDPVYMFAAELTETDIAAVAFGDEGQYWRVMAASEFLAHARAVPYLQRQLLAYLNDMKALRRPAA